MPVLFAIHSNKKQRELAILHPMPTPSEKGTALEDAVAAIERHILSTSPALCQNRFLIEGKKIINVNGVHHEIDIFVTIDVGGGYKSVFIFECKNWEEAVGKNEIIIFAEKIAATQSQKGYFVAKSFTKDAEAQAATNPRIQLVIASQHEPTTAPLPLGLHGLILVPKHIETMFHTGNPKSSPSTIDITTAIATLREVPINLRNYLAKWAEVVAGEDALSFRSHQFPEGSYERSTKAKREFDPGEFVVNEQKMAWVESKIVYLAVVVRPAVVSYFEVEKRGRAVALAPVQIPSGETMKITLIYT